MITSIIISMIEMMLQEERTPIIYDKCDGTCIDLYIKQKTTM